MINRGDAKYLVCSEYLMILNVDGNVVYSTNFILRMEKARTARI